MMRIMGLEAIHPKRRLSLEAQGHRVYPYLLRGLKIEKPNQVWSTEITYIPIEKWFMFLVAVLDWYSRFVLSWSVSNTMDTALCLEALNGALKRGKPEILNTDQGSQFTSSDFTARLQAAEVQISMDGRGRVFNNIFIERLWRTVKYEDIYLKSYESGSELIEVIGE